MSFGRKKGSNFNVLNQRMENAYKPFHGKHFVQSSKTVQSIEKNSSKVEAVEQSGGENNKLLQLLSLIFLKSIKREFCTFLSNFFKI